MCLITEFVEPEYAKKDLIVYKVLKRKNELLAESPFQEFRYVLNQEYGTRIVKELQLSEILFCSSIDSEYFRKKYKSIFDVLDICRSQVLAGKLVAINQGFHSCYKKAFVKELLNVPSYCDKRFVYECVTPKGTLYYRDAVGGIVSEKIIIKKEIDIADVRTRILKTNKKNINNE